MVNWWKLLRGWNLLFVAAIPLLIHFGFLAVIEDYLAGIDAVKGLDSGYHLALNTTHVILLAISVTLVAAGGYVINDVYDQKVDAVNKPKRRTVGKTIGENTASRAFWVLSVSGSALGVYVAYSIGHLNYSYIHLLSVAFLYLYAVDFKARVLIGNIMVALLAGLNVLIIAIYDLLPTILTLIEDADGGWIIDRHPAYAHFMLIAILALFAFINTLIREIIKDNEDAEGDRKFGYKTLATLFSPMLNRIVLSVIILIELGGLIWITQMISEDKMVVAMIWVLIGAPLIALLVLQYFFSEKKHYQWASLGVKALMFIGLILPIWLFNLTLTARAF